jgi:hypothetical protein
MEPTEWVTLYFVCGAGFLCAALVKLSQEPEKVFGIPLAAPLPRWGYVSIVAGMLLLLVAVWPVPLAFNVRSLFRRVRD